jgi:hypothetical protein
VKRLRPTPSSTVGGAPKVESRVGTSLGVTNSSAGVQANATEGLRIDAPVVRILRRGSSTSRQLLLRTMGLAPFSMIVCGTGTPSQYCRDGVVAQHMAAVSRSGIPKLHACGAMCSRSLRKSTTTHLTKVSGKLRYREHCGLAARLGRQVVLRLKARCVVHLAEQGVGYYRGGQGMKLQLMPLHGSHSVVAPVTLRRSDFIPEVSLFWRRSLVLAFRAPSRWCHYPPQ